MKIGKNDIDRRKLVLYLLDEISEKGRHEVEAWLSASGVNREEYELLEKTWKETGDVGFFPREIELDKTWEKFSARIEDDKNETVRTRSGRRNIVSLRILYAAAAVTFLAWISITMVRLVQNDTFRKVQIVASNEFVLTDTLGDGSVVSLNENSSISYSKKFTDKERRVSLQGEAFFEVKPDSVKPFIVESSLGTVRVLGTLFQVRGFENSDMVVYVEDGIVEISSESQDHRKSLMLVSGDRGIIKYPDGKLIKEGLIKPDELFWANRKLIFKETKLSLVFELLRKHYETEIEVDNDAINSCLLTATFDNEEIDQILAVIAASFELDVDKKDSKYIIKGTGCSDE